MSNRVPEAQAKKIREIVYQEADKYNYLARTRTDNGQFFARLVAMPSVGGVLAGFIQRSEIRTYIKDAILNRYSKDKKRIERPRDLLAMCRICFGVEDLEDTVEWILARLGIGGRALPHDGRRHGGDRNQDL